MNEYKKKNLVLVIVIICIGIMLAGGTYAYLNLSATVINSVYKTDTSCFLIDYTDNGSITGTLHQSSTPNVGLSGTVDMKMDPICSVPSAVGTIKLNVDSSTSSLLLSEGALKYAVYINNNNNTPVSSGTITSTGEMILYENFLISMSLNRYTVYVWLDGNVADSRYVNLPFSGYIYVTAIQGEENQPGLYSSDGTYTSWDTLVANGDVTLSGTMITDANDSLSGELVIADGITSIGDSAFSDCINITIVVFPFDLETIGQSAFLGCDNLTTIIARGDLSSIEDSAFSGCTAVTDIYYGGTVLPIIASGNELLYNATIHCDGCM